MTQMLDGAMGARGLCLRYGHTIALEDVSVTVTPGQITAVVGGDGAGKTSLLRCLAGAIRQDAGEVRTPGPSRIGYLPASSGIYPDLTVAENLAFRATAYRMPAGEAIANPKYLPLAADAGDVAMTPFLAA